MSTSKHIDKICCIILTVALILTIVFMNTGSLGVQTVNAAVGYVSRLFDTSTVHTIDIVMDDWDSFIEECTNEEYVLCTVIIDGEAYRNVAIRAKGNTSLSSVASYGNDRYSFKIEFDHYDDGSYYGLDKLCLNNIIQDNTYMKDYLTYRLMREFGADAPLCSFSYITVNGEDWGLYLAVEGVEESFLQRNYGSDYGQLYKPDSMDMGGGRGNGRDFDMENFDFSVDDGNKETERADFATDRSERPQRDGFGGGRCLRSENGENDGMPFKPESGEHGDMPFNPESGEHGDMSFDPESGERGGMESERVMGSSDVKLVYTDDDFDSYSNIFDSAKDDITDADKSRLIESLKKLNYMEDIESVVDVDEVIRYFVVHNFVVNFDSYTGSMIHNYYLYEDDGQFSMIPWDYNLAFGGFESSSDATSLVNYPIDTPVSGGTVDSRPMLAWIFENEESTELYHQYFAEFIAQCSDNGYFTDMIDSVSGTIAPYVESDPSKFCTYEEFVNGVSALREFCLLRAESVSGQLDGTIPSTSDGQSVDSSTLIDASELNVSDMGSMGNTMGGGGFPGRGEMPDSTSGDTSENGSHGFRGRPDKMQEEFRNDMQPDAASAFNPLGDFGPPDIRSGNAANNAAALLMLGISAVVLVLGIVTALLFRRRKRIRHH